MLPPDVRTLRGAADELGVTYGWLQSNWRSLEGFPPPYIGGGKGQSPRWALAALTAYKDGRRWTTGDAVTAPRSTAFPPANDISRAQVSDDVAALIAAAG